MKEQGARKKLYKGALWRSATKKLWSLMQELYKDFSPALGPKGPFLCVSAACPSASWGGCLLRKTTISPVTEAEARRHLGPIRPDTVAALPCLPKLMLERTTIFTASTAVPPTDPKRLAVAMH